MDSNDIFRNSQVERLRELKYKVASLTRERDEALATLASLKAHFTLALAAAHDVMKIPEGGEFIIIDGWNAVFDKFRRVNDDDNGEEKEKRAKEALRRKNNLIETVKNYAAENKDVFVWLVFDGDIPSAEAGERWRVSYTGGIGDHRADKMVCNVLQMIKLIGLEANVTVMTNDRDFIKEVKAAGANVAEANALCKRKEIDKSQD
jgi:hypothetical protein